MSRGVQTSAQPGDSAATAAPAPGVLLQSGKPTQQASAIPTKPTGVCENCARTWRATTPLPRVAWCWHRRTAAALVGAQWEVLEGVSDRELRELRAAST
jgi:hypothetical protein